MLYFAHNEYHWNSELRETKHQMKGRTEWKPTSMNKETSSPTLFVSIRNHRYTMFPAVRPFFGFMRYQLGKFGREPT